MSGRHHLQGHPTPSCRRPRNQPGASSIRQPIDNHAGTSSKHRQHPHLDDRLGKRRPSHRHRRGEIGLEHRLHARPRIHTRPLPQPKLKVLDRGDTWLRPRRRPAQLPVGHQRQARTRQRQQRHRRGTQPVKHRTPIPIDTRHRRKHSAQTIRRHLSHRTPPSSRSSPNHPQTWHPCVPQQSDAQSPTRSPQPPLPSALRAASARSVPAALIDHPASVSGPVSATSKLTPERTRQPNRWRAGPSRRKGAALFGSRRRAGRFPHGFRFVPRRFE